MTPKIVNIVKQNETFVFMADTHVFFIQETKQKPGCLLQDKWG